MDSLAFRQMEFPRSCPAEQPAEQRNQEQDQKNIEQYARNTDGCAGNPQKTEHSSDQCYDKENNRPSQHSASAVIHPGLAPKANSLCCYSGSELHHTFL